MNLFMIKLRIGLVMLACLICIGLSQAQKPQYRTLKGNMPQDTTKKNIAPPLPKQVTVKPYKNVITEKAITQKGFFAVHKVDEKYYFEIADSLLGRDILIVGRIARGSADIDGVYSGDQIGSTNISFEKGPGNKLFMNRLAYNTRSKDSTQAMYKALERSNMRAIVAAFPIAAYSPDSTGSVIDVTDFISSDNDLLYFSTAFKSKVKLSGQMADKSYMEYVHAYAENIEIRCMKTYGYGGERGVNTATLELNASLLLLPKIPMKSRIADSRVGYFSVKYTDYDANPQGVKQINLAARWRLEPKPEDVKKYLRGELVEPQKPIVFYIDPSTPEKWIPYLIQGVNDWKVAFEKAGFKNAIMAKRAPSFKEDSTWSLEDASHAAIVYKASDTPNASGPSIPDPRSGEIIESHVNWYHNIMKLVHDWYFIQCGAINPEANKMVFNDKLMGELIRFVSSHEVGHTLGLLHNYGASSATPVEKLRDNKWLTENGHTCSIMDYARFNYVAQPEDKIDQANTFPHINDYDKWAIEWGYRWYPDEMTPEKEVSVLNTLTIEKQKNRRLWFGNERNSDDPRSQNEDLGDNAMKANEYGIKNLKRIVPNLVKWTSVANEDYDNLSEMYKQLIAQLNLYGGHAAKYIGGIYETPKTVEQAGPVYEYVPADLQKEALTFLDRNIFTTPDWLLDNNILNKINQSPIKIVSDIQNPVLARLLNVRVFVKLIANEATQPVNCYKLTDLLDDLHASIWKELKDNQPISVYRRNLQKSYLEKLIYIMESSLKGNAPPTPPTTPAPGNPVISSYTNNSENDIVSIVKFELGDLRMLVKTALPNTTDIMSRAHLQDVLDRMDTALEIKTETKK